MKFLGLTFNFVLITNLHGSCYFTDEELKLREVKQLNNLHRVTQDSNNLSPVLLFFLCNTTLMFNQAKFRDSRTPRTSSLAFPETFSL